MDGKCLNMLVQHTQSKVLGSHILDTHEFGCRRVSAWTILLWKS